MIYLDYSEAGKSIKAATDWIKLKDPSTARTLVSVVAAGLISITVFSFSMVMVVLNQAASQLSNRILDKLVGNRLHQFIIGFYIGNIIFALLLLTAIRDIESGIYVPALSTYLLILLSVISIFLFVLFLHFITQSIKYTTIIRRISSQTLTLMKKSCLLEFKPDIESKERGQPVVSQTSGIFEAFDQQRLVNLAVDNDCIITLRYPPGDYVLENSPIANVYRKNGAVTRDLENAIVSNISIVTEPTEDLFYSSGFRQLSEIAIKALSPGINDPGTAAMSLQSLFSLLAYRREHFPDNNIRDENGKVRVITNELSFEELFERYILPIWDYGKNDRTIRRHLSGLLKQLEFNGQNSVSEKLLQEINQQD